jgi:hypothetical protein
MKHWITLLSLVTAFSSVNADELEFALSDKSIDGSYEIFYSNSVSTKIALMHTDVDNVRSTDVYDANSYFRTEDGVQTDMLSFGVFANSKHANLNMHIGGKIFYLDSEHSNEMHALAVGGGLDAYVTPTLFFSGELFYAPDIITGGDYNNYLEASTRINFQVVQNAVLFVGYKLVEADFEREKLSWPTAQPIPGGGKDADRTFFEGAFIGMRFNI